MKFTPRYENNKVVCIRISCEKLKTIDKLANSYNMSRNKFICQCLDFALDNLSSMINDKK